MPARPFVKWAGGKGQLLERISEKYPAGLGRTITKYCEPFVGGGAVLFDILGRYSLEEVRINDINAELMNTYSVVQTRVEPLIELLSRLEAEYHPLDAEGRKAYFYSRRDRFNQLKMAGESESGLERAALFIFLNRTCFNGLYRVNRKGCFNVPVGAYKMPLICDSENLRDVSGALRNVRITCGDYRELSDFIDADTFVYLDPPYRPLSASSSFTSYTEDGFDDRAQIELAEFIQEADGKGAKVLLSNSDPKNADESDNFFDDLYAGQTISRIHASRSINSKAENRGKISELLIANFSEAGETARGAETGEADELEKLAKERRERRMAANKYGGGAKTNKHGLKFEQETSLEEALENAGYDVVGNQVYQGKKRIATIASKNDLYKKLLKPNGVDWKDRISQKLLPDEALYVPDEQTVYIIEKKFQNGRGSVDEKLQTCHFKKRQYKKLFSGMGVDVEYLYVCSDWFKKDKYEDVREYIEDVGCHIFFGKIPIKFLGL